MKYLLSLFLVCFVAQNAQAYKDIAKDKRAKIIGNSYKDNLEVYHYRDMKINDDVSKKAFDEFIKRVDVGKQFLLASDVKKLEKYRMLMDDQLVSGNHKLVFETMQIIKKRVNTIDKYRKKFFKNKKISFKTNDSLELDPDKRKFLKTDKQLEKLWAKSFKHSVLTRYMSLVEEQNTDEEDKKDKKKKKKKEKKLTDSELRKKAIKAIDKKYKKMFDRVLTEEFNDYIEDFFNAIGNIYDPHTMYFSPQKKEDFDIDISGQLEGIGAVLSEDGSYIKVVKVIPGGAAWKQKGLEIDDVILLVTQDSGEVTDLVDMRVGDAVRYIRGPKGSVVKLTVKKVDGSIKVVPIKRDVVVIEESFAKSSVLEHKKLGLKVGYIHVPKFYRDFQKKKSKTANVTYDVKVELERLKKSKVKGMILDLRNNTGGALEDARLMSGLFIEKGPIVQIKNHRNKIEIYKDDDSSVTYDGPLIVLINRFSASASEILAAALQDYNRAVIVGGEFSHGKGTVQVVFNINENALLRMHGFDMGSNKITVQKFYRVTGESTQYRGVTPDVILPDPFGYVKSRERDIEYSLPWDKIEALSYKKWKNDKWNIKKLKKRSANRVKKSKRFDVIEKSVDYLTKRREDTTVSLNIEKVKKQNAENKKMSEKLKLETINKDIQVSNVDASLKAHSSYKPKKRDKKWEEEFAERKKEWVEALQKDPILEESIFILDDIIKSMKGKKLSMVSYE
jgi:carboxyl-terminal processing protease